MPNELKVGVGKQMSNISSPSGKKIVQAKHFLTLLK
jgi:hypothetical protein